MYIYLYYICAILCCVVPYPVVQITILDNETLSNKTIGDPLTLHCTVTAVRGISSSADITWTTEGREVRRVENIMASMENGSTIYTDSFKISSLSLNDNGRLYECTVAINANDPASIGNYIQLNFIGMYISILYMYKM